MVLYQIAERISGELKLSLAGDFFLGTPLHKRAVFCGLADGRTVGFKGVGWTLGPPYSYVSSKDSQLWFGLMDHDSANREVRVSNELTRLKLSCAEVLGFEHLTPHELLALEAPPEPKFSNGTSVRPSVLATAYRSWIRVSDCFGPFLQPWLKELYRLHPGKDHREIYENFAVSLAESIVAYQSSGAVNDTLGPENLTLAGELTDYEWFFFPGIPLPDQETDTQLFLRQEKEFIYFVETLQLLAFNLSLEFRIRDLKEILDLSLTGEHCGFTKAAREVLNGERF